MTRTNPLGDPRPGTQPTRSGVNPSPCLEVQRLRVEYSGQRALNDVSLTALSGQVTAVLGPNGAGKTSLLEAAQGLRPAAAGTIRLLGRDHRRLSRSHRARIGVMLQDGGLAPALTPREAVTDRARLFASPHDVDQVLAALGLEHCQTTRIRHLSGGEAKRTSLAVAMISRPQLLFLDEPSSGLDPHGREVMNGIVRQLALAGVAVVLTTHQLDDVESVADRVIILNRGDIVADGSLNELTFDDHETVTFTGPLHLDLGSLLGALPAGSEAKEVRPGRYMVSSGDRITPSTLATIAAWCAQHDVVTRELSVGRHSLRDVYLRLTQSGAD
jgi:ABC-2 type transport system ATP-binding protein